MYTMEFYQHKTKSFARECIITSRTIHTNKVTAVHSINGNTRQKIIVYVYNMKYKSVEL